MLFTLLADRDVKTNAPHDCEWCAETIPAKAAAQYRAYIFESRFIAAWMHPECNEAMFTEDPRDLENGWDPGDYQRGTTLAS